MTLFKAHPSQVVHAMDDKMLARIFSFSPVDPEDVPELKWEETETGRWSPYHEDAEVAMQMEIVQDPIYGYYCVLVNGDSWSEHLDFDVAVKQAQDFYANSVGL